MTDAFKVPDGYQDSFRRLIPYMAAPLQKDPKVFESLLIYLKLGGEKLARVAVDAYNANQRQLDAEMMRRIREEVFFEEASEDSDEDEAEENEEGEEGADSDAASENKTTTKEKKTPNP